MPLHFIKGGQFLTPSLSAAKIKFPPQVTVTRMAGSRLSGSASNRKWQKPIETTTSGKAERYQKFERYSSDLFKSHRKLFSFKNLNKSLEWRRQGIEKVSGT